jgi:hypothetical protein
MQRIFQVLEAFPGWSYVRLFTLAIDQLQVHLVPRRRSATVLETALYPYLNDFVTIRRVQLSPLLYNQSVLRSL